ncbi:hypothetical protein RIVM261_089000 [Rivularia sp. IAM M-261]|nr:hypothetical protein RIVM261_089000 [Rivularia sp. IAM M-261]
MQIVDVVTKPKSLIKFTHSDKIDLNLYLLFIKSRFKTMTARQPKYSFEDFASRGDEIYETNIRPQVEASNRGKIVAIDIDTGAWEMDTNEIIASKRLRAKYPDAQIWFVRIGSRSIRRFGRTSYL